MFNDVIVMLVFHLCFGPVRGATPGLHRFASLLGHEPLGEKFLGM